MRLSVLILCPVLAVSACSAPDPCMGLAGGSMSNCRQSEVDKALIMAAVWGAHSSRDYQVEPVYHPTQMPPVQQVQNTTCFQSGNMTTCN